MDVQCPQCGTVFEFDERQMRGPSAMLKCSVCQSMFRLETLLTSGGENQARWMVRNAQGDVLYFPSFDKLYRLIMERKVSPDDEVSRTGQKWTRLSDINEFMPVFQVVESILSSLTQGKQAAISRPPEAPALLTSPEPRPRSPTIQQYASSPHAPRAPTRTPAPQPPAPQAPAPPKVEPQAPTSSPAPPPPQLGALFQPEEPPAPRQPTPAPDAFEPTLGTVTPVEPWVLGEDVDAVDAPVSRPPGRSRAPLVFLLLLVLLLVGGVGYLWAFESERAQAWIDSVRANTPTKTPTPDPTTPSKPPVVDAAPSLDAALQGVALAVSAATNGLQNAQISQAVELGRAGIGTAVASANKAAARKASRSDVGAVLKRASRALSRGDKFKARGLYHDALDLDPRNVKAMTGLGWTLISMGKADSASAQFKRAIHFNADFEDAYIGLGKAERQRGRSKAALNAYERYLKRFPQGRKRSIAEHQRTSLRESLGM